MQLSSIKKREIRKFGFLALIFFGCLCGLAIWNQRRIPIYLFGLLSILGLGFIIAPVQMKLVYIGWRKIAFLIGRVITIMLLTITYYLVITPSALLKRIFGGAPLPKKPDINASSYWVDRTESAQQKKRFLKRY